MRSEGNCGNGDLGLVVEKRDTVAHNQGGSGVPWHQGRKVTRRGKQKKAVRVIRDESIPSRKADSTPREEIDAPS